MLLGPALVGALVGLTMISFTVIFLNMTSSPHLADLYTSGITWPPFGPKARKYWAGTHVSERVFGLTAVAEPLETTRVSVQAIGKPMLNSTSAVIVETLSLAEPVYPQEVAITVEDTAATASYMLQVFKWGIFPESITISGDTAFGKRFSQCIPWGYLYWNHTVHLPKGLLILEIRVTYSHFEMSFPWKKRSNNSFATYFDPALPREKCTMWAIPSWAQATVAQASAHGCFYGLQPRWSSCGQTRQKNTERFLQFFQGNVSGRLCASTIVPGTSNLSNLVCRTMLPSPAALAINVSEILPQKSKDTQAKFTMPLRMPSGSIDLVGDGSLYQPRFGFTFTLRKRTVAKTFLVATGFAESVVVHGEGLRLTIADCAALAHATVVELTVLSEDLDCHLESLSLENGTKLDIIPTARRVCQIDSMAEMCEHGWKPSSSFALPVPFFREHLLLRTADLQLVGQPTCKSFTNFGEPFDDSEKMAVSLRLNQERSFWAFILGQELHVEPSSESCWRSPELCVIDFHQAWASSLHNESSKVFVTVAAPEDYNISWKRVIQVYQGPDLFREEKALRAEREATTTAHLCVEPSLKVTKECGGALKSSTIQAMFDISTLCLKHSYAGCACFCLFFL